MPDIEEAIDRSLAGPERRARVITPAEKEVIAYHEAGHALAGWVTSTAAGIHRVLIVARGRALGYTLHLPLEERCLMRRSEMIEQLVVTLAGRVAEELVFDDPTSGTHDDLRRATGLARKMVCEFGMSDKIGPVAIGNPADEPFLGRDIVDLNDNLAYRSEVDTEIRRLLYQAKDDARQFLTRHRRKLDALLVALITHETLEREAIETLFADVPKGSEPLQPGDALTHLPVS
jgi:cell division protease FtsH